MLKNNYPKNIMKRCDVCFAGCFFFFIFLNTPLLAFCSNRQPANWHILNIYSCKWTELVGPFRNCSQLHDSALDMGLTTRCAREREGQCGAAREREREDAGGPLLCHRIFLNNSCIDNANGRGEIL